jgi:hypothetical protein
MSYLFFFKLPISSFIGTKVSFWRKPGASSLF